MDVTGGLAVSVAREALAGGAALRLRVRGRSMRPTIADGATIEVRPCDRPPRPGEILACASGERLVVHRLVRIEADGALVLRGDALVACDPSRPPGELLGRVVPPPARPSLRALLLRGQVALLRARVALTRALRRAR